VFAIVVFAALARKKLAVEKDAYYDTGNYWDSGSCQRSPERNMFRNTCTIPRMIGRLFSVSTGFSQVSDFWLVEHVVFVLRACRTGSGVRSSMERLGIGIACSGCCKNDDARLEREPRCLWKCAWRRWWAWPSMVPSLGSTEASSKRRRVVRASGAIVTAFGVSDYGYARTKLDLSCLKVVNRSSRMAAGLKGVRLRGSSYCRKQTSRVLGPVNEWL
jgi:hypothetical protein